MHLATKIFFSFKMRIRTFKTKETKQKKIQTKKQTDGGQYSKRNSKFYLDLNNLKNVPSYALPYCD